MPLSLEHRRVGDIVVVTCVGRLVEGAESIALQRLLDDLLQFGPYVLLHVGGVNFIDSAGLGLLARYTSRTRNAHGSLKLCTPSPRLAAALKATRLDRVFETYDSESAAVAAFYERPSDGGAAVRLTTDVLCVVESLDVQAYVRELLGRNGFGVLAASNIPDALVLLQATRPKVVVVSAGLGQARGTNAAEKFRRLADEVSLIELPPDFSQRDPGDAGQLLLERVRAFGVAPPGV